MGYPIALPDPITPATKTFLGLDGLATTGISGDLTLTKPGTTPRTATFPDASIEVQATAEVVSANWTARNHGAYTAIATATVTDPGSPVPGHEFLTLVRNGTLTTARGSYGVAGTLVASVWHSGAWADYPFGPLNAANTWTAAQTFSVAPVISTLTGLLKGNGASALTAAVAGTDYLTPSGSGAALTSLNASNISSGTLADARLSANVGLLNAANTWTAAQTFSSDDVHRGAGGAPSVAFSSTQLRADGYRIINSAASADNRIWDQVVVGASLTARSVNDAYGSSYTWLTVNRSGTNVTDIQLNATTGVGIAVTPTAGNGLLQLASGTTKANGIAFGTDTFLYRNAAGWVTLDAAGSDVVHKFVRGSASAKFQLDSSRAVSGTISSSEYALITADAVRIRIGGGGELHMFGGTPVTRPTYGAPSGGAADRTTFDTTTVTLAQLAQRVRAIIDDFRARGDFA